MCGINGFYLKNLSKGEIKNKLIKMNKSLKHRGPDGDGIYIDSYIGLGHTRLSIRELSELGSQPMLNNDRSIICLLMVRFIIFENLRMN